MFMQDATTFRPSEKITLTANGISLLPAFGGSGILAASLVETPQGWRRVGTLMRGSLVHSWDGGLCAVAEVEYRQLRPWAAGKLVHVPGGVLGACSDLCLMPDQMVLIASAVVEEVLEAAAALVPAASLAGFRGVALRPLDRTVDMVTLRFERDEIIYANSGMLIHCGGVTGQNDGYFPRLAGARARAMLDLIDAGAVSSDDVQQRAA